MAYRLVVNGVALERVEGIWHVRWLSGANPSMPCDSFKKALARALLEASPVEWPDDVEDEVLDAVRALAK